MKSGDLQRLVISTLRSHNALSVREILIKINEKTGKEYAYTTISTTLQRLEQKEIVKSKIGTFHGRSMKLFEIQEDAPRKEARKVIGNMISQFGISGVKHLSEVFTHQLTDDDLERIRKEFQDEDELH